MQFNCMLTLAASILGTTARHVENGVRLQDRSIPEFSSDIHESKQFNFGTDDGSSTANHLPGGYYLESKPLATLSCPPSGNRTRHVAVIGAGPGGSSAAFWLGQAQLKLEQERTQDRSQCQEEIEIVLFEKEERIGGRTTVVHPYNDEKYEPVELGASIFADVNRNMVRSVKRFNLPTNQELGENDDVTSVWDGQQFVFENLDNGWWNSAKMLWRYGYSPMKTEKFVGKLVDRFLQMYDPKWLHEAKANKGASFPWSSIEDLANAFNFSELAAITTLRHFYRNERIAKLFVEEIVEAATRVNYGQNVDEIHALGGGVSLAASGAASIQGGNFQIFERMVGESGAKLRLGSHGEVSGIIKYKNVEDAVASGKVANDSARIANWPKGTTKYYVGTTTNFGELYDAVFFAAPWATSGVTLLDSDLELPPTEYVRLHVTMVTTNATCPKSEYFGRGKGEIMPKSILTSYISARRDEKHGDDVKPQHPKPEFNSLNYLKRIPPRVDGGAEEHVVKIFSTERLSDETLDAILGLDTIGWVFRKEWDAYPRLKPTREFPPLVADERFYYLNAMEPLISTMETSTVSSRNAVALLLQEWYGPDFVHGGDGCDRVNDADWASWGCHSA